MPRRRSPSCAPSIHPEATAARPSRTRAARCSASFRSIPPQVEQWTFLGRGWTVGLAHEAALKLREACQAWTEAYPAFEYRHGPIAIAAPGPRRLVVRAARRRHRRRRARDRRAVVDLGLDPLASLVVAQQAAVALADARGLDPDHPRNLSRSVVLTDGELQVLAGASA